MLSVLGTALSVEAKWFVLAAMIPSALFLVGVVGWGMSKVPRGMDEMARDAGWKRIAWGIYLAGPWGGPYKEPDRDETAKPDDRPPLSRRPLLLIAIVFGAELLALAGGAAIAHALDRSELAGAIVGLVSFAILIGATWLVRGGMALRSEIARRG